MKLIFSLILGCTTFCLSAQTYSFPKIKSNIVMPIRIPLAEMSKMVNNSVKDLVYEDNSYTDNNNDQFKVKVWKTKPIRLIGGTKNNIIIEVPLKIWAEKGVGTLGVYSYQNTTFETVMYFSSTLDFKNNWTMSSTTVPHGFKWITKPVLDFGTIKIPITSMVEKSLKEQQTKFSGVIDEQIKTQLNLQPYVATAWNLFKSPFEVSKEFNTWLKVTPINASMSPLKFYADAIDTTVGIDVYSETFTGFKPSVPTTTTAVSPLTFVDQIPQSFMLQTTANIPFTEATAIARNQFLNKVFEFREGKNDIKVTDIAVNNEDDRVNIDISLEGTVNGLAKISGLPKYSAEKHKIVLTDTKFKLKTSNILHKTLLLLFKGKIIKMIEEEYGIPTTALESEAKKGIEEAFNKEYQKGLKLNGRVYDVIPNEIMVQPSGLTAVINTKAAIKLSIIEF